MTVFYILIPGGESLFTFSQRVADKWAARGATIILDPIDSEGDAFTGAPNQHLASSVDESGAVSIDVSHHEDIAAAAVVAASYEAPPRAEVVVSVASGLEVLAGRVAVLEAEKEALVARVLAIEAWARTLVGRD